MLGFTMELDVEEDGLGGLLLHLWRCGGMERLVSDILQRCSNMELLLLLPPLPLLLFSFLLLSSSLLFSPLSCF
jgi:hypothetical protein